MFRHCALPLVVVATFISGAPIFADEGTAGSSGTLKIADQAYELKHAVAYEAMSFDEKVINVLLTAKPIDTAKLKASLEKDGTDDHFNSFETQVKVKFDKDGKASYTFAYDGGGTSINISGPRLTGEAAIKDGKVTGQAKLVLDPEDKGRFKSQFEIKFNEPLLAAKLPSGKPDDDKPESDEPERPKTAKSKSPKTKKAKSDDDDVPQTVEEAEALAKKLLAEALGDDEDAPKTKKGKGDKPVQTINVKDLPLPEGASEVAYKKIVQQLTFNAKDDVETTAESFSAGLKKQGWERSGSDLIGANSAILKRKRGKAELTIFVNPSDEGSKVTMMTSGLSWDEK